MIYGIFPALIIHQKKDDRLFLKHDRVFKKDDRVFKNAVVFKAQCPGVGRLYTSSIYQSVH